MSDTAEAANTNVPSESVVEVEQASQISAPRAVTAEVEGLIEISTSETSAGSSDPAVAAAEDAENAPRDQRSRAQIKTARLDSRDFRPSWPIAIAALEQLSGWSVLALRLGTLALIQQCVRELAEPDARADLIVRLRALTDALAHMPLET